MMWIKAYLEILNESLEKSNKMLSSPNIPRYSLFQEILRQSCSVLEIVN